MVEGRFGRSVASIFEQDGEAVFRDAESEALSEALDGPPAVIATGGGIVLSAGNRRMLSTSARVVWLRAHPAHLQQRLEGTTEAATAAAG